LPLARMDGRKKTEDGERQKSVVSGQEKTETRGQEKRLPVAKELGETSLMFLVHPTLTEENMHWVVGQVEEVMSLAKE
jgi:dTDP-4-amino-4,6-dideoxygalactose transaminase